MLICFSQAAYSEKYIWVNKKNVDYVFKEVDEETDFFAKYVFPSWEKETFEIFDQVKDPEGLAIDLGAWIGTTSIWLSKHFHHVIAVDADVRSLMCLQDDLMASNCPNVSICARPMAHTSEWVIFGPRENRLNKSTSCIKERSDQSLDCLVQGITFKQLVYDYIYANEELRSRKISFIKCDIEGGEEAVLEGCFYILPITTSPKFTSLFILSGGGRERLMSLRTYLNFSRPIFL